MVCQQPPSCHQQTLLQATRRCRVQGAVAYSSAASLSGQQEAAQQPRHPDGTTMAGTMQPVCWQRPSIACRAAAPPGVIAQGTCRLKMTVAYDGCNFAGFQYQTPKVRTVQAELEKAAARVLLPAGRVVGASRTDGGAHATGQVAHLDVAGSADNLQFDSLMMYLNGVLPDDVKVQQLEVATPGFDSHFSSVGKEYIYKLSCGVPDPIQSRYCWWMHDRWCEGSRGKPQSPADLHLEVDAMQEAAEHLLGLHDFSTFMDNKRPAGLGALKRKKPKLAAAGIKPVRTAEKNIRLLWQASVQLDQNTASDVGWRHLQIHLAGNGFLYRMVRLIAAGLVEVGHGRISPRRFKQLLAAGDRSLLPIEAAPPQGLYLQKVLYQLPDGVDASQAIVLSSNDDGTDSQQQPAEGAAAVSIGQPIEAA